MRGLKSGAFDGETKKDVRRIAHAVRGLKYKQGETLEGHPRRIAHAVRGLK